MSLDQDFEQLIDKYWGFLAKPWPVVKLTKHHRSGPKEVKEIDAIKMTLSTKLGIIPVFFFLTVLFGTRDYVSPYRNVEKGLLILYHLVKGLSLTEMDPFIPRSSFNDIYQDFYVKQLNALNQQVSQLLENMFSNIFIRIQSAAKYNPDPFKHVTLLLDGHDTRGEALNQDASAHYSYKLTKSGLRTQIMTDINDMILYVSSSDPCAYSNDGTMFVEMKVHQKIHNMDCLALDGGYPLFIPQVIANSQLNDMNFCYPIRKPRGTALTDEEARYNHHFGSFRSQIEAKFSELGSTFERLNNKKYIRVSEPDIFNVQLKLACLLLNIKKFVLLRKISPDVHHSKWLVKEFDFNYQDDIQEIQQNINVHTRVEYGQQMSKLQQQLLTMRISEISDEVEMSTDDTVYDVENILDHRGEEDEIEYLVRWRGYGSKDDSWEPEGNFASQDILEKYWKKYNQKQRRLMKKGNKV